VVEAGSWSAIKQAALILVDEVLHSALFDWAVGNFEWRFALCQEAHRVEVNSPVVYGNAVIVTFTDNSPYGKESLLRNVTEIHWAYNREYSNEHFVAFESDVHGTGITYPIRYVAELETSIEGCKAEAF